MGSLSVVIPTIGRDSLRDTLAAIPGWAEVILVADGPDAQQRAEIVTGRPVHCAHESCWGHPQRNLGMTLARGDWLCFIDDDDVHTPEAFPAFERAMRRPGPTLFRMAYDYKDLTLWAEREVAHCNVGTPMLLTPNDPTRLGEWPSRRTGDFDFIRDTVQAFGGCEFDETIVCTIRDLEGRYVRPGG